MTNSFKRTDRIAELMQRKLAHVIQQEVKDPRLPKFITITGVSVSKDLSHAKVYFNVFEQDKDAAVSVLGSVSGFLRSALAKSIDLRIVPHLEFIYDDSMEHGNRLSRLIDEHKGSQDNNED